MAEDEDLAGNRERFALKELGFKMFDLENATKRLLATKLPGDSAKLPLKVSMFWRKRLITKFSRPKDIMR